MPNPGDNADQYSASRGVSALIQSEIFSGCLFFLPHNELKNDGMFETRNFQVIIAMIIVTVFFKKREWAISYFFIFI